MQYDEKSEDDEECSSSDEQGSPCVCHKVAHQDAVEVIADDEVPPSDEEAGDDGEKPGPLDVPAAPNKEAVVDLEADDDEKNNDASKDYVLRVDA